MANGGLVITVQASIPVLVTITGLDVFTDQLLSTPATFPASISGTTSWYVRGGRDATVLLTVTDTTGTVVIVQQLYSEGQSVDVDAFLTPAMVASLNAAPHTWASE